jgi:lipoprotein-anchoring transpeptidase ErfK/SrfK
LKTNANRYGADKKFVRLLVLGIVAVVLGLPINDYVRRQVLPFGLNMPPLDGAQMVDPRMPLTVEATGFGSRLGRVEMRDETGKVIAEAYGQSSVTFASPLAFGTRHRVKATVERPWFGQSQTREIAFTTVAIPKLDGPSLRMLAPDSSVTLHFDLPVGELQTTGELRLKVKPDAKQQTFRLVASEFAQDHTYPVQVNWTTSNGVPLPPFKMELATAPPLSVETNLAGESNLGLALPMIVSFSEPLAEGTGAGQTIKIKSDSGKEVSGKWERQGKKSLRFTPQPGWPPSSTIEVSIDPQAIRSVRGGTLLKPMAERFTTGSDRHIYVYLDAQRMEAVENGQVVRTFKVSTGKSKTPTVTGNFYIYDRYRHKTMRSDGNVRPGQHGYYEVENVPYTQFFHKDYAFHGAFWHNNFGHTASHGCVNMSTKDMNRRWPHSPEDAGWLFHWAALGVPVTVYGRSPTPEPKVEAGNKPVGDEKVSDAAHASGQ